MDEIWKAIEAIGSLLVGIAAVIAAADQLIKYAVVQNFALGDVKELIHGVLSLTHIRNTGAAWSMMAGKTWFLIGMPLVIIVFALGFIYKNRHGSKLGLISMAMVLGGGIGNLIDRIRLKEVVDYIRADFINFPIFNFADICVVIGAVLFCIYIICSEESEKKDKKAEQSAKADSNDGGDIADGE